MKYLSVFVKNSFKNYLTELAVTVRSVYPRCKLRTVNNSGPDFVTKSSTLAFIVFVVRKLYNKYVYIYKHFKVTVCRKSK